MPRASAGYSIAQLMIMLTSVISSRQPVTAARRYVGSGSDEQKPHSQRKTEELTLLAPVQGRMWATSHEYGTLGLDGAAPQLFCPGNLY